jgi:hypothetical protein
MDMPSQEKEKNTDGKEQNTLKHLNPPLSLIKEASRKSVTPNFSASHSWSPSLFGERPS